MRNIMKSPHARGRSPLADFGGKKLTTFIAAAILTLGFAFSLLWKPASVVRAEEVVPYMQVNPDDYMFASHYWPLGIPITMTITGSDGLYYTCQYYMHLMSPFHTAGGCDGSMDLARKLVYGDTATITDGTTTDIYTISNMQVTDIDLEADAISGIATPGNLVAIHTAPDAAGSNVRRWVTVDEGGYWLADFHSPSIDPDGNPMNDTYDIKAGSSGQAYDITNAGYEYYGDGNATWIDWCVPIITGPVVPVELGQVVNASVVCTGPGLDDTHTISWDWGDGSTTSGSSASAAHSYTQTGVYTINVTVTDATGESDTYTFQYVVIYDPNGGFVTGGGWINSPAGAYVTDSALTGKATFGFISKYQEGANVPTGDTEFQFHVANLNFKSTAYDWLVIAGSKAQYKGIGTINGAGKYKFMLTATSGSPDKFRIKIWDKVTDAIVYDNMIGAADDANPTTALGGGSIVIHKAN